MKVANKGYSNWAQSEQIDHFVNVTTLTHLDYDFTKTYRLFRINELVHLNFKVQSYNYSSMKLAVQKFIVMVIVP